MIICSWDVGITHMAYCIMEYAPDNDKIKFPIHGWNNINLINKTKGEEALIESYLLSNCKYLYRVTSNFTIFTLILNPELSYEDLSKTYKNNIIKEHNLENLSLEDFLEK